MSTTLSKYSCIEVLPCFRLNKVFSTSSTDFPKRFNNNYLISAKVDTVELEISVKAWPSKCGNKLLRTVLKGT